MKRSRNMVTIPSVSTQFAPEIHRQTRSNLWSRVQQELITGLAGWLPKKPGILLRRLLYPRLFARMGKAVSVEWGSDYRGTQQIEIGNNVFLGRMICLDADVRGGQIQIDDDTYILDNVRMYCHLEYGKIIVQENVGIDRGVDIKAHGGCIEIGRGSYIGPYVCMAGPGHIKVGENCMIAAHSGIYANNHIFVDPMTPIKDQGTTNEGIVIEDDCWLGTGVKVLDGVTIGQGSVIGAGAVVTKDIPPYSVAVGIPAMVISQRGKQLARRSA
ncbi:acyltransferase [Leptolyngbya sp. 7M]|uniref:acyltransferase n=1 Tax=Leptolyngbya sp. 7M TaxID=2812896 RepID=UPI001CED3852|nr:acyltransferase [Leptolyngbya sp. 7M]